MRREVPPHAHAPAPTVSTPRSPASRLGTLIEANYGTFRGLVRAALGQCEYLAGTADRFIACDFHTVRRLVFVCWGNINRSAFGHVIANDSGIIAMSLGLSCSTGSCSPVRTVAAARRFGVDLTRHRATDLKDFVRHDGDLYLVMEPRHARQMEAMGIESRDILLLGAWSAPRRLHIHDPHELSEAYLMTCLSLIQSGVINLVDELRRAASPAVASIP